MPNKNTFSSIVIAKRIVYACINFSVAIFIISIITVFLVLFGGMKVHSVLHIYPSPDHSKLIRDYFFKFVFSPMIISSIFGIILFTVIYLILSRRLRIFGLVLSQKESKQNLDSFKLRRISNYKEFNDIYFNTSLI